MTKKEYRDAYKQEECLQYLEDKASFDFTKECKNKKALFLVGIMAKQHIGYKLEYKNLACKRWGKWVKDDPSFSSSDMLNPADIKATVREFYRQVATGELSWADGIKRQLEFTRSIDGLMELRVIGFIEGYFTDSNQVTMTDKEESASDGKSEHEQALELVNEIMNKKTALDSINELLEGSLSLAERKILEETAKALQALGMAKSA
jgi:hypothetical protein